MLFSDLASPRESGRRPRRLCAPPPRRRSSSRFHTRRRGRRGPSQYSAACLKRLHSRLSALTPARGREYASPTRATPRASGARSRPIALSIQVRRSVSTFRPAHALFRTSRCHTGDRHPPRARSDAAPDKQCVRPPVNTHRPAARTPEVRARPRADAVHSRTAHCPVVAVRCLRGVPMPPPPPQLRSDHARACILIFAPASLPRPSPSPGHRTAAEAQGRPPSAPVCHTQKPVWPRQLPAGAVATRTVCDARVAPRRAWALCAPVTCVGPPPSRP